MTDAYEREQMPGVGAMLFRHKVTSPRWLMLFVAGWPLLGGLAGALALAMDGQAMGALAALGGGAALGAVLGSLMLTFASARIAVSEGELHVQLGLAGPRIPMAEIAKVEIAPSGSNKIGMGVRTDLRGSALYTLWGDNARAVHVTKTDGTKLVFVMKEPDAMARAIEEAMTRATRGPRVRVEIADEHDAQEPSEASRAARRET